MLRILAPTRYPWTFNGPRASRHCIRRRSFIPFNKISYKLEGFTVFNPWPPAAFDLVHAFNRIPVGTTPFVIGFESHLPRAFNGGERSRLFRVMTTALLSDRCRAIIAISQCARRLFLEQHRAHPALERLEAKLCVRYPNLPVPKQLDRVPLAIGEPLRLVFVGNQFGRKGGTAVVRLAERARLSGFPLEISIVSALDFNSWVGPTRQSYWSDDLRLMAGLDTIRHYRNLPNDQVLALVRQAHFVLLPTFCDSFGFNVLEAMAYGTPAMATMQGALPEFLDGNNGVLLPLSLRDEGDWAYVGHPPRDSAEYEQFFDNEIESLARAAFDALVAVSKSPARYAAMREAAWRTAGALFSADDATAFWDDCYDRAVRGPRV